MSSEYVLRFQGLPPGSNQTRGANRFKLARETKMWRELSKVMAQKHQVPALGRIRLEVIVYRRALGTADESNDKERAKPLVDGLVDAGVIRNDRRGDIVWVPVREAKGAPGIELRISEIAPACTRCHSVEDDVAPVLEGMSLCLKCYAKLVGWFMTQHEYKTVEELVATWKPQS